MGLFDYVRCEVPLPDGFDGELQTKDFDCPYMETYTITKDGRLLLRYVSEWVPTPESEWKYTGDDDPLHKLWHESSKKRPIFADRDINFHGMLGFYGHTGRHADGTWRWHEYSAKFTDGQLIEIVVVIDPIATNSKSPIEERPLRDEVDPAH
jgi:hypothetical protein